jgi:hypothetical protein
MQCKEQVGTMRVRGTSARRNGRGAKVVSFAGSLSRWCPLSAPASLPCALVRARNARCRMQMMPEVVKPDANAQTRNEGVTGVRMKCTTFKDGSAPVDEVIGGSGWYADDESDGTWVPIVTGTALGSWDCPQPQGTSSYVKGTLHPWHTRYATLLRRCALHFRATALLCFIGVQYGAVYAYASAWQGSLPVGFRPVSTPPWVPGSPTSRHAY